MRTRENRPVLKALRGLHLLTGTYWKKLTWTLCSFWTALPFPFSAELQFHALDYAQCARANPFFFFFIPTTKHSNQQGSRWKSREASWASVPVRKTKQPLAGAGVIPGREQYVPGYRKKLSAFIVISKVHCLICLVSMHAFGLIHGVFDKKKIQCREMEKDKKSKRMSELIFFCSSK